MATTYQFRAGGIKCLFCNNISHNSADIRELYCGFCKQFHSPHLILFKIDYRPTLYDRIFIESPDVGHPDCKCSHCAQLIEKGVPIRFYTDDNREYRYHQACLGLTETEDEE